MQFLLFVLSEDACGSDKPYFVRHINGSLTCYTKCPALSPYAEYSKQCVSTCGSNSFQSVQGTDQSLRCVPYCTSKQVAVGKQNQCMENCPSEAPYSVGQDCMSRCPDQQNYISEVGDQCVSSCGFYRNASTEVQQLYNCTSACTALEYYVVDANGNHFCVAKCPSGLNLKGRQCVKYNRKDRRDAAYSVSGLACGFALVFLLWSCWQGDRAYQSVALEIAQSKQETALPLNKLIGGPAAIAQLKHAGISRSLKAQPAQAKMDGLDIFVPKKQSHITMAPQGAIDPNLLGSIKLGESLKPTRPQGMSLGDIQD